MLIVLAEFDCLNYLRGRGIYPDEFFTDFELFKNKTVVHTDMRIIVILAGCCKFNKRCVCEFVSKLRSRQLDKNDKGVVSIEVVSDALLPMCNSYYKFTGQPNEFELYDKLKRKGTDIDVWSKYKCDKKKTKVFLEQETVEEYQKSEAEMKLDELISIIKVPRLLAR